MTAEVAVMNRLAVALAADSAVTLERGAKAKIFQNENKIFELSSTRPIGIMLYNATQFYGVPWEIIIKDFRAERGNAAVPKLFDYVPLFCEWLIWKAKFGPGMLRSARPSGGRFLKNSKRFARRSPNGSAPPPNVSLATRALRMAGPALFSRGSERDARRGSRRGDR